MDDQGPKDENGSPGDALSENKWSGTGKMMVISLVVSGLLLLALLLTIWLGGEPTPLSVDYDGFD